MILFGSQLSLSLVLQCHLLSATHITHPARLPAVTRPSLCRFAGNIVQELYYFAFLRIIVYCLARIRIFFRIEMIY